MAVLSKAGDIDVVGLSLRCVSGDPRSPANGGEKLDEKRPAAGDVMRKDGWQIVQGGDRRENKSVDEPGSSRSVPALALRFADRPKLEFRGRVRIRDPGAEISVAIAGGRWNGP